MDDSRHPDTTPTEADTPSIQPGPKVKLRTLDTLDGRTGAAKRARQIVADIRSDLGGDPSSAQRELTQRAGILGALIADYEARYLSGQAVDQAAWFSAVGLQHRVLVTLGLERKPRNVTDLSSYLASKARE
jgi:hypothetical protein